MIFHTDIFWWLVCYNINLRVACNFWIDSSFEIFMTKLLYAYLVSAIFIFLGLLSLRKSFKKKSIPENLKQINYKPIRNYGEPFFLIPFGCFLIILGIMIAYKISISSWNRFSKNQLKMYIKEQIISYRLLSPPAGIFYSNNFSTDTFYIN